MMFQMTNNATGSGMGTSGLVGQITTYQTMTESESVQIVLVKIILLHFILPALIAWITALLMRKKGLLKDGDMKLSV